MGQKPPGWVSHHLVGQKPPGWVSHGLGVPLWAERFVMWLGREGAEGDDLAVEQHVLIVTERAIGMIMT